MLRREMPQMEALTMFSSVILLSKFFLNACTPSGRNSKSLARTRLFTISLEATAIAPPSPDMVDLDTHVTSRD